MNVTLRSEQSLKENTHAELLKVATLIVQACILLRKNFKLNLHMFSNKKVDRLLLYSLQFKAISCSSEESDATCAL